VITIIVRTHHHWVDVWIIIREVGRLVGQVGLNNMGDRVIPSLKRALRSGVPPLAESVMETSKSVVDPINNSLQLLSGKIGEGGSFGSIGDSLKR
jgi:CBS-domain-containing membrane protein